MRPTVLVVDDDDGVRYTLAEVLSESDVDVNHLHIDTAYIERDLNVALPTQRLLELAEENVIGSVADYHYSIMGFQGDDPSTLENLSGPEIAQAMSDDEVDLAILAPV